MMSCFQAKFCSVLLSADFVCLEPITSSVDLCVCCLCWADYKLSWLVCLLSVLIWLHACVTLCWNLTLICTIADMEYCTTIVEFVNRDWSTTSRVKTFDPKPTCKIRAKTIETKPQRRCHQLNHLNAENTPNTPGAPKPTKSQDAQDQDQPIIPHPSWKTLSPYLESYTSYSS